MQGPQLAVLHGTIGGGGALRLKCDARNQPKDHMWGKYFNPCTVSQVTCPLLFKYLLICLFICSLRFGSNLGDQEKQLLYLCL